MRLHILGICGTFMGSLAVLARQLGHEVSGSDANVYPPMSTQLQDQGINLSQGYSAANLQPRPDLVIIGNAMSRGNPAVEHVLSAGIPYCSGPEWLSRFLLQERWVLGVAGTHGKTTTTAMLAWILQNAGLQPGYLIGGVARNFSSSANLGREPFFVVEADEYDTAFFDKRSKFIHYAPRTVILNNLEFDHGDIFADLAAIQTQFHHLLRTVPGNGLVLHPVNDPALDQVISKGCWTPRQQFGVNLPESRCRELAGAGHVIWNAIAHDSRGSQFSIRKYSGNGENLRVDQAEVRWDMIGLHNVSNGLAAVAAAHHAGVALAAGGEALNSFSGVRRRMELRGEVRGIRVYDDFAHHPSAIATTLQGAAAALKNQAASGRLIAVVEPRSNTMKMGIHQQELAGCTRDANFVLWRRPLDAGLDMARLERDSTTPSRVFDSAADIVTCLVAEARPGDHIVIMSNGGFEGIHENLLAKLADCGSN